MNEAACLRARAHSLIKNDAVLFDLFELPASVQRAYLDIETDLAQSFIWLVGMYVEQEARTYSFFAASPKEKKRLLLSLLEFLDANPMMSLLTYSNCAFEKRVLQQRLSNYGLSTKPVERIQDITTTSMIQSRFHRDQQNLKTSLSGVASKRGTAI